MGDLLQTGNSEHDLDTLKTMDVHIFGIRHHGPGSARNLVTELRKLKPQAVLIEGPPDANALLSLAAEEGMRPPVAVMVYDPTDFSRASYFPFAHFSPEWQAILYALEQQIPAVFIDLPVGFHPDWEGRPPRQMSLEIEHERGNHEIRVDPLGYLAKMAGHGDGEQWWEETFERCERMEGVFPIILELMTSLREEASGERGETLLREAFMRKSIRDAAREGHERVAVVCGAWHAPALERWKEIPAKDDNALLRGLPKKKTVAAWVPWSYEQLSRQKGYGAGVISPAWYDLLFTHRKEVAIRWMTRAARLFRKEGNEVSPAHVIEASRLAETLAALRERQEPGPLELKEAVLAVFCHGDSRWLKFIEERLVIGDEVGAIGERVPKVPLQKDIEKRVKKARLTKFWESSEVGTKNLDLRKENQLQTSYLLHSLLLLGIPWAKEKDNSRDALGTFHEDWRLEWQPTHALRLTEAAVFGGTVEEAGTNRACKLADETDSLEGLSQLLDRVLKANISGPVSYLSTRLQNIAAQTHDVWLLMRSLPPLLKAARYGSIRRMDVGSIQQMIDQILPRIFVGLPSAGALLDEENSREFLELIAETNHYLHLHKRKSFLDDWMQALLSLEYQESSHPYIQGGLCRLFFDRRAWSLDKTFDRFEFALSAGQDSAASALWLEGFLQKSGLLLMHHPAMWTLLDNWVDNLTEERFNEVLALLRRAFARIPKPERTKLLKLSKISHGDIASEAQVAERVQLNLSEELKKTIGLLLGAD